MATSGDPQVQYLGLLALALIPLIPGLVVHSFIIGVNVNNWLIGRSVTPVDHIITSLGISRMCTQCVSTLYMYICVLTFFMSNLDSHLTLFIIGHCYTFFTYVNIWLTSLLSIVFCLKICNLNTRLFLYLRGMIVQRTVYFIVASIIVCALNNLITLLLTFFGVNNGGTYNTTMAHLSTDCIYMNSFYDSIIRSLIALFFYYISTILLFTSLYHHMTRMKRSSNLTINLEAYYSAMKFVSFTFIYSTIYFISHLACVFYYYYYCIILYWLNTVLGFLPVLHSSYLIYTTAKLRNLMSKYCQNVIDFWFRRKDAETTENIEVVAQ